MHNLVSFYGLGQLLSHAFAKPAAIKPSEKVSSIARHNEVNNELVHAFSLGSEPAFRSIYDHYAPAIYRVSLRYFQSGPLAEDLVGEVFATLWQRRAKFSEPEEIRLFLFTASKSTAMSYLNKMVEVTSMKEKVIYTEELKRQLHLIKRTTTELVKEVPEKSVEQFLAEIKFVMEQLEELREFADTSKFHNKA